MIFKICGRNEWAEAEAASVYEGSVHDHTDGFIHFSTAPQLAGTLAKHYAGRDNLLLIAFDPATFGDALKWEPARNGDLFPHLYAPLPTANARWTKPLQLGEDGIHVLPDEVTT